MVRANHVPHNQLITSYIIANNRNRLNPPLPVNYFGNCILAIITKLKATELVENSFELTASLLHQSVVSLSDKSVCEFVKEWLESPFCYHHEDVHDYNSIAFEHSPKFNVYGNEFVVIGKLVVVRTGPGNKAVEAVFCYPRI
ncbi:BAHD acyltransferase DCR [Bienertia sinuspersici]